MLYTIEAVRNAARTRGILTEGLAANSLRTAVAGAAAKRFDVFLSHSFADQQIIAGLYAILTGAGVTVYVDWIEDPQMDRNRVTPATAEHIRTRMRTCRSLVYAASESAAQSKWMPWELGYFDGFDGHVAILPVTNFQKETFAGSEYLGLYPYIAREGILDMPSVTQLDRRRETVRDWLNRSGRR